MDVSHCLEDIGKGSLGKVVQVMKKDTQRLYALKTIQKVDIISRSEGVHILLSQINSPFIVPLKFAFQSPEKLYLSLPFVRGGHLFYYLQREQRFDVNRSRFYAAELLCALECLHNFGIAYYDLKPGNILLDSLGHIVLCDFGLCQLEIKDEDRTIRGTLEYPAPELLLGQGYTRTVDWWTLGVILYELLIGLPPFYDEDTNEIHRKILSEPLQFPDSLPLSAKDILTKLLNRKPQQRLGANGASEIKAHLFFHDIDWHKLLQRKYEPTFKPDDVTMVFSQYEPPTFSETIKQFSGWSYNQPAQNIKSKSEPNTPEKNSSKDATIEAPTLPHEANPTPPSEHTQETVEDYDAWVLIWDEASPTFYFYNRFTNARQPVNAQVPGPVAPRIEALAAQKPPATRPAGGNDPTIPSDYDPTVHNLPSQSQMQDALEAALKAGYQHMVSQLLKYGMDLNIPISRPGETPLGWAIEHENLDLVKLFLDKGADANFTIREGEPALIKAVEKGNQRLVEVLVQKTDQDHSTRALGRAVNRQDTTLVNMLSENGVKCDFEESDRPRPHKPDSGCYFFDISQPDEFIPPLVRAVYINNVSLVRLLLASGADVNVSYHDLRRYPHNVFSTPINMSCGRAIQLAMELRHHEMVQLLLDFGTDISLARPVWKFRECQPVLREVYLRAIAGLRAVAAARN